MILVTMKVNGRVMLAESDTVELAKKELEKWLDEVHKNYPNAKFVVSYYEATKIEVAD